jgi:uncharacterized protein
MRRLVWLACLVTGLLFAVVAVPALAQTGYPDRINTYINDYNGMMSAGLEAKLRGWLTDLKTQHNIEMTVVTVNSTRDYNGWDSTIERFATSLFNRWGVGDAATNKGIMLLVARNDRKVRLELGAGYDTSYDKRAKGVIDEFILPPFKRDDYEAGIEKGVRGTIFMLTGAWPAGGAPTVFEQVSDQLATIDPSTWWIGLGAILLGIGGTVWYRESHRCPNCGKVGLNISSNVLVSPTHFSEGEKEVHKYCPSCQYDNTSVVSMSRLRTSSSRSGGGGSSRSSGGGGGRSSGGGATGSW